MGLRTVLFYTMGDAGTPRNAEGWVLVERDRLKVQFGKGDN